MTLSRRRFLSNTAPLATLPFVAAACGSSSDEDAAPAGPFRHGVASGDPLTDRVVLWTRVTPGPEASPVEVSWTVFADVALQMIVAQGTATTDAETDFTVKIDASGLEPGRTYYYRFSALGADSFVGRTKTLPEGRVERLRFAVASCSNYPYGLFNAYALIARRADLDAVLHLGDYLYEYANDSFGDGDALGRIPDPDVETRTLSDYRRRHAQYKTDRDLQEAHRQHPFITVWDDHEVVNDAWQDGAPRHRPETDGDWQARKQAAIQAYFEWMPIRQVEADGAARIYRSFRFGNLLDLVLLDTRLLARDQQASDPCDAAELADPARQLLGAEQEEWLLSELFDSKTSGTVWRAVGQQVMFAQLVNVLSDPPCAFNVDQWDGYGASRQRVLQALVDQNIDNVVILTGDIHSSWGNDVTFDPFNPEGYDPANGSGSLAVEFVTPSITSPGIEDPEQAANLGILLGQTHPHVKYVDLNRHGYMLVDITAQRAQAEWYHVETIREPSRVEKLGAALLTQAGENRLQTAPGPSEPIASAPPLAAGVAQSLS